MEFCQDSQFKLEIVPSSTEEYVDSLTFLDEIQEQVQYLLNRLHAQLTLQRCIKNKKYATRRRFASFTHTHTYTHTHTHTYKSLQKPEIHTSFTLVKAL